MYDLVWAKPMREVAADLGISDVGLKKACDRHRVPTPGIGYWAKKQAGQPVKQPVFVTAADLRDERITIAGGSANLPDAVRSVLVKERERRKPVVARPLGPVQPVEAVPVPDQAVLATARLLRRLKVNDRGLAEAVGDGLCGVAIGPENVERAIYTLDAVARGLRERDLLLVPGGNGMKVTVGPDQVDFTLKETVKRIKHEPTVEDLAREARMRSKSDRDRSLGRWTPFERAYPEFDFVLTGELVFKIDIYANGLRLTWKDGKRQRVEALADDIVITIVAGLASERAKREERERWAVESQRREERRQRGQARAEREKKREDFVGRFVDLVEEAARLRAFVSSMKARMPDAPDAEFIRLIDWADARIQTIEARTEPGGIAADLRDRRLFPEVDPYAEPSLTPTRS